MQTDNSFLNEELTATITISVADQLFALPTSQLIQITPTSIPTLLPFAPLGIEGIIGFDNKPLVQINVAQALGLNSDVNIQDTQTLIVKTSRGVIALKIDHIFATHVEVPTLPIEQLAANLVPGAFTTTTEHNLTTLHSQQLSLPAMAALIVTIDSIQIAILIELGISVEQAVLQFVPTVENTTKHCLAVIGKRLLPVCLLNQDNVDAGPVIIGRIDNNWHAVLVTKFIGLQALNTANLVLLPDAKTGANLGLQHNGATFCLYDFATLANSGTGVVGPNYQKLLSYMSEYHSAGVNEKTIAQETADGIKVSINGSHWQIPFQFVICLQTVDLALLTNRKRQQRLFAAIRWFFPLNNTIPPAPNSPVVQLRLAENTQIALLVDSAVLKPTQAAHPWLPLPTMPYIATVLFDAIRFEADTGGWILRVNSNIDLTKLLRCCRRQLIQSCLGRLNS